MKNEAELQWRLNQHLERRGVVAVHAFDTWAKKMPVRKGKPRVRVRFCFPLMWTKPPDVDDCFALILVNSVISHEDRENVFIYRVVKRMSDGELHGELESAHRAAVILAPRSNR